jgi:hypothetical protein
MNMARSDPEPIIKERKAWRRGTKDEEPRLLGPSLIGRLANRSTTSIRSCSSVKPTSFTFGERSLGGSANSGTCRAKAKDERQAALPKGPSRSSASGSLSSSLLGLANAFAAGPEQCKHPTKRVKSSLRALCESDQDAAEAPGMDENIHHHILAAVRLQKFTSSNR